jgi:cytochrome c oxidase assembly protein subunit 15
VIRRLAAATAVLAFILIVAGGVVTNTDSGLACPDWPTCFGSAMPRMVGNVAVEHTHRLIAAAVGLCSVALVVLTLRRGRQGARGLGVGGL